MEHGQDLRRRDAGHRRAAGPDVVLDNIRSAWNVGSIFRTCEGAGVRHLYLCGISAYPPNPRVLKTALGAEQTLPWSHHHSAPEVVAELKRRGARIVAVELSDRSRPYTELAYPAETALVFGHETHGVALPLLECADDVVAIPMAGRKSSLNVAVSVGIVLFEIVRQRRPEA